MLLHPEATVNSHAGLDQLDTRYSHGEERTMPNLHGRREYSTSSGRVISVGRGWGRFLGEIAYRRTLAGASDEDEWYLVPSLEGGELLNIDLSHQILGGLIDKSLCGVDVRPAGVKVVSPRVCFQGSSWRPWRKRRKRRLDEQEKETVKHWM